MYKITKRYTLTIVVIPKNSCVDLRFAILTFTYPS